VANEAALPLSPEDDATGHAGPVAPAGRAAAGWLRTSAGRLRVLLEGHTSGETIPALDGLRGVAASLVFLVHYHAAFGALLLRGERRADAASAYASEVGYHGVNVFFVLSGYLIYASLLRGRASYPTFFKRRVRRIYPTFLVVLLCYLAVAALAPQLAPHRPWSPWYVVANALLLPGVFDIVPVVTVSWSLSYEIFFYLGLAALVATLRLRRWSGAARIAGLLALFAVWAVGGAPVHRVARNFVLFLPGMLVAELVQRPAAVQWLRRVPAWLPLPLFAGWLLALPLLPRGAAGATLTVTGLAITIGLMLAVLVDRTPAPARGAAARWLGARRLLATLPLRYVGLISYSFYLIHGAVTNVLARGLGYLGAAQLSGDARLLLFVGALPLVYLACVAVSAALFLLVERPLSLPAPRAARVTERQPATA
jgi:peptidoglycan/LPS O-acetylase OafA/YrhL